MSPRLNWLIKFRRLFGLFAFFYATLHMLTYVALYSGFDLDAMVSDIAKRRFITMGVAAYLLLVPLALTSTTWAIRKLGGKNWNRLHKLDLCRGNLWSDSLLVAGEDRRHHAAHHHAGSRCAFFGAACNGLAAAPQGARR